MQIFIFTFYLFIVCYLISSIPFFKNAGLAKWKLISLYLIKVAAGVAYALFYRLPKYFEGADTWRFYDQSVKETKWLLSDPIAFCKDLFVYGYSNSGNLFSGQNSYWNDLKSNVVIKLMAAMNVITFKSYYADIVLFNFLFLFGLVALFKVFNKAFPAKKNLLAILIFLLPSTLFWCSGIHKDGLILSATGLVIYCFCKQLQSTFTFRHLFIIVICIALIFMLRNYVVFALLPALFCWYVSEKSGRSGLLIFPAFYLIGVLLFFVLPYIFPTLNFPLFLATKQNEFLKLQGSSAITSVALQPNFKSYISYLPTAIDVAIFRPHVTEIKNVSYIPAIVEVYFLLVVVALSFLYLNRKRKFPPLVLFLLFFSASILMIAGFTITFSGAIVRYRSFVLPLLITPLICMIDIERLKHQLGLKS